MSQPGPPPGQQQQAQAMPPTPAPTEEQMAFADAGFRPVPLAMDPNTHLLASPTHDMSMLNALIRSLKQFPPQIAFPPPPNVVPPQRSQAINQAREGGKKAFEKKDFAEAIRLFTLAVDVAASRPLWENNNIAREELALCLANRSAAFAAVEDWIGALCDADACIRIKRQWSKAHYRRGRALVGLGRIAEARDSFQLGLQFDPDSADLQQAIDDLPNV